MGGKTINNGNSIESFFVDKVILITGATGFLGQALVEKLLRSCPRVSRIYVLIRSKRSRTVEERLEQLKKFNVFDRLRVENPRALEKICPIQGDVSLPNLGLKPEDRNMLVNTVNIVFHSAATIRFDEPLKVAINLNTKGTDRILDLSKDMKDLISFVYVSTAYCNPTKLDLKETVYTAKLNPYTVIDLCNNADEKMLDVFEKIILTEYPNTYTFSKNLAEQIVSTKGIDFPVSIIRPSVIAAAQNDPFPGWVKGYAGFPGFMTFTVRGSIAYVICDTDSNLDIIPVDYVVDTMICIPWHRAIQQKHSPQLYNCTNNAEPFRMRRIAELCMKHARGAPSQYVMWYPDFKTGTSTFMYVLTVLFLQYIPAIIMDGVLCVLGKKPLYFELSKNTNKAIMSLRFFITRNWNFHRTNMHDLTRNVKGLKDSSNFNTDMGGLDWDVYMLNHVLGIRKFLFRENLDIDDGRKRVSKFTTSQDSYQRLYRVIRSLGDTMDNHNKADRHCRLYDGEPHNESGCMGENLCAEQKRLQ